MNSQSHHDAFALLLLSAERPLSETEQSHLDAHLAECPACRAHARTHAAVHRSLHASPQPARLTGHEFSQEFPRLIQAVEKKRMAQKAGNLLMAAINMSLAYLLIIGLVWTLNRSYPRGGPAEIQEARAVPSAATPAAPAASLPSLPSGQLSQDAQIAYREELHHAEANPTPPLRSQVITYTVQPNDTIYIIAMNYHLRPETILWGNYKILAYDPRILEPGMELTILPVDGVYYEWSAGDDLIEVATEFGVDPQDILNYPANHLDEDSVGSLLEPNIRPGTMLIIPGGQGEFPVNTDPHMR